MACTDKDLEDAAKVIFKEVDTDNSGFIDSKEIENALRKYNNQPGNKKKLDEAAIKKEAGEFISIVDQNKDGKVSYQEFLDLLKALYKS